MCVCAPCAGSSRGPSPLSVGLQDTLPVAAAFTETVNAYFKGADPSKYANMLPSDCVLKKNNLKLWKSHRK